jgi:hypothetical protein
MPIWPREPDEEPAITSVLIRLDSLSAGERRDLANALLRAAWSAALENTRILLLDLFIEVDEASVGGTR